MKNVKLRVWAQNAEVMVYQKDFNEWIDGGMMEVFFDSGELTAWYQMQQNYGEELSLDNPPLYSTDDMVKKMQFTGLFDKNGREIWEGDIVKEPGKQIPRDDFEHYGKESSLVAVSYDDRIGTYQFGGLTASNYFDFKMFTDRPNYFDFEVVGNIYENKNLVQGRMKS